MALLLTQREREVEKQKEQERLVKESSTLGRKVDELRELEQSSKKRLQDFQEKEFAKLQDEQDERKEQLVRLDEEIKRKQKEWAKLLDPLDKQFALYVKTERGKIEEEQARQSTSATKLNAQAKSQVQNADEQTKKELELKQQSSNLATLRDSVESDKRESVEVVSSARNKAQEMLMKATVDKKTADETLKKAQIVLREAELKLEAQDNREKEIEDRELAVIVQELKYYSPVKKSI